MTNYVLNRMNTDEFDTIDAHIDPATALECPCGTLVEFGEGVWS